MENKLVIRFKLVLCSSARVAFLAGWQQTFRPLDDKRMKPF